MGAAAVITAALGVRSATKHGAPPPPEPAFICVVPDVTLMSPAPRGEIVTPSGLSYRVLAQGTGAWSPTRDDVVELRYRGWNERGEDVTGGEQHGRLPVKAVVPGFAEALELMHPGERIRVTLPTKLAYATMGPLTFDIELIAP